MASCNCSINEQSLLTREHAFQFFKYLEYHSHKHVNAMATVSDLQTISLFLPICWNCRPRCSSSWRSKVTLPDAGMCANRGPASVSRRSWQRCAPIGWQSGGTYIGGGGGGGSCRCRGADVNKRSQHHQAHNHCSRPKHARRGSASHGTLGNSAEFVRHLLVYTAERRREGKQVGRKRVCRCKVILRERSWETGRGENL